MNASPHTRSRYHVPNLSRALQIVEHLAGAAGRLGVSELAEELRLPKNSVFRILATLTDFGYVQRDEASKKFQLSCKLLSLGYAAIGGSDLVSGSLGVLRRLRDQTEETTMMGMLTGDEGIVLEQVPSRLPIKFLVDVGTRFPLHTAAPAKAMLAFLGEDEREDLLGRIDFTRFNRRTLCTQAALREDLRRVRQRGWSIDEAEQIEGLHCVGAPVMNHWGYPVAAVWVTGPSQRLTQRDFPRIGKLVKAGAMEISKRLGYIEPRRTRGAGRKVGS